MALESSYPLGSTKQTISAATERETLPFSSGVILHFSSHPYSVSVHFSSWMMWALIPLPCMTFSIDCLDEHSDSLRMWILSSALRSWVLSQVTWPRAYAGGELLSDLGLLRVWAFPGAVFVDSLWSTETRNKVVFKSMKIISESLHSWHSTVRDRTKTVGSWKCANFLVSYNLLLFQPVHFTICHKNLRYSVTQHEQSPC